MPALMHPERSLQVGKPRPLELSHVSLVAENPSGVPTDQGLEPGVHLLATLRAALNYHGSHVLFVFFLFFLLSAFQGRECLAPNRQICLVPASARGTLAWKVLPAH